MAWSYKLAIFLTKLKAKQKLWGMGEIQNYSETKFASSINIRQLWGHLGAKICSRETDKYLLSILQDMLKMLYY